MSPGQPPSKYPGFGLPLDYVPGKIASRTWPATTPRGLFPNALSGEFVLGLTTLREFRMMQAMDAITDKAGWERKVFDREITSKWRSELVTSEEGSLGAMSEKMTDYIIAELQHRASQPQGSGIVVSYDADVVKSDTAVPQDIQLALQAAVLPLENVPDIQKDWHPGSEDKVLDLVHPSLFPLVYGRSNIVSDGLLRFNDVVAACGSGSQIPLVREDATQALHGFSEKFQWLPCEIDFKGEQGATAITSYVNNLHPDKFPEVYGLIARIVDSAIPLWNQALSGWHTAQENLRRIPYSEVDYTVDRESAEGRPAKEDYAVEDDWWDQEMESWDAAKLKWLVYPEPAEFKPTKNSTVIDLKKDYEGLQVIVKLANIHLSPEKSFYEGGTWHVEGQNNEHICATALYYYDSENITESRLAFRQSSDPEPTEGDIGYDQNDHQWLEAIFGCSNEDHSTQEVGKRRHRKILALFLVDPNIRIISTANVPPQQREWWAERLRAGTRLGKLPQEIFDHIIELVDDFPIGLAEAKAFRGELMEERKTFVSMHDEKFRNSGSFSLCEH